jgi:hypothetical protein
MNLDASRYPMRKLLALCLLSVGLSACVSTSTTQPTTPNSLTGVWSGDITLQGASGRMTWTLTQNDASVSGPILVVLPTGTVLLNGALTGTLSGTTLTYVINIGAGAIPSLPACTGQLGGSATVTLGNTSTMTGTYSVVSSSCTVPLSSGTFTLTKM